MLLGGRLQPMTRQLTFFDAPAEVCVEAWMDVRGAYLFATTGHRPDVRTVSGDIDELLEHLLPLLSSGFHKAMFVPVASDGPYQCCLLTDSFFGDLGSPQGWLAMGGIGCAQILSTEGDPRYADDPVFKRLLCVVTPVPRPTPHRVAVHRLVGLSPSEGGRLRFMDDGEPLPFEDVSRYKRRRVADRFTNETLIEYCRALGLRPFDADFYAPDRAALLIEPVGLPYAGARFLSLEESRRPDPA